MIDPTAITHTTLMLATAALGVTDDEGDRLSVDEVRDEMVLSTKFSVDIAPEQVEDADWDVILAEAGWTVVGVWIDYDGYWCAHVRPMGTPAA